MIKANKIEIDLRDDYGFENGTIGTRVVVVDWDLYQNAMRNLDVDTRNEILGKMKMAVAGYVTKMEE